ncbi:replication initiation negative regulator SeqA [Thalassotalea profundi]|uniref:Negative modulator of initiation of replication n=1 Tax=Thalassotalea profundi TaxID=2036687 RepID=A0ABQ3IGL9_9GAMM|nr:replication initiation negative regulator SeqA [Thalassotalea profundi]GHE77342.1 negative modulator of initiation of replication [Thalassotalea profundi]
MKNIEVDEELYQYIVTNTQEIGESASSILRRLLKLNDNNIDKVTLNEQLAEKDIVNNVQVNQQSESTQATVSINSLFDVINKEELAMQRGAVGRFLIILAALHRVHQSQFSKVCEIRGRDRLYFATSETELEQSGSSTKPRQIPDSNFWVITNSNTTRKKMMLTEVAKEMGYTGKDIEAIRDLL